MENIYPNNETGPWRQLWVAPSSLGPTPLTSWMRMICAQYIEVGPGGLGPGRIGGTRPTGEERLDILADCFLVWDCWLSSYFFFEIS